MEILQQLMFCRIFSIIYTLGFKLVVQDLATIHSMSYMKMRDVRMLNREYVSLSLYILCDIFYVSTFSVYIYIYIYVQ